MDLDCLMSLGPSSQILKTSQASPREDENLPRVQPKHEALRSLARGHKAASSGPWGDF